MKFLIHAVLALVTIVGLTQGAPSAYSNPVPFNVSTGAYSAATMDPIYLTQDCEGISAWCELHPIPLNAIDVENGREIIGYEVICDDLTVAGAGVGTGFPIDQRDVPRGCGKIVLKYAPQG